MKNRTKQVHISITDDFKSTLTELEEILQDIGVSKSLWFRTQSAKFISKYKNLCERRDIEDLQSANSHP